MSPTPRHGKSPQISDVEKVRLSPKWFGNPRKLSVCLLSGRKSELFRGVPRNEPWLKLQDYGNHRRFHSVVIVPYGIWRPKCLFDPNNKSFVRRKAANKHLWVP